MADRLFTEPRLAELYDTLCAGRPDFAFYLPLVMEAGSVLDVGCGTGELLIAAKDAGHAGRLTGLDPAEAMLGVARRREGVEWVRGDLSTFGRRGAFDLIVMTGHAFQVLVEDDELRAALAAVRAALADGGRFVFETRNPLARDWERWTGAEITDASGTPVRVDVEVRQVTAERVTFTQTYTSPGWERPEVSWSTLRFLGVAGLAAFLTEAGLEIEAQYGDWNREPLTGTAPEIITFARRDAAG
ncbi:class I SAM-dependent methyltransferase [Nonomuraea sp. NPDC050394]|uniref:class I SAM-dependent methyltransferase n=1 Tax=Nonomuraea sp. NPDC050394 TaxID=3364363 RepID=UPI00379DC6D0